MQWFPSDGGRELLEHAYAVAGDGMANLTIAVPSEGERRWIEDRRVEITGMVEDVTEWPLRSFTVIVGPAEWWEFPDAAAAAR